MDQKVLQSETQNNHKPNNSLVMDCGSALNNSFELKSIERQLHSAISSRTLSISRLSDHHHPPSLSPPQQPPQPISKKSSKFSRSFHKLLRSIFGPKTSETRIARPIVCYFRWVRPAFNHSRSVGEWQRNFAGVKLMAAAAVIRKLAFEQFTITTSNGISCA